MNESTNLSDMLHPADGSIRLTPHDSEYLVYDTLRGSKTSDIVYCIPPSGYPQVGTIFYEYTNGKYGVGTIHRDFYAKCYRYFSSYGEAVAYLELDRQIGAESVARFLRARGDERE